MLQIKGGPDGRFKIKSIRKADKVEEVSAGATCSLEPGDGSDKPPC